MEGLISLYLSKYQQSFQSKEKIGAESVKGGQRLDEYIKYLEAKKPDEINVDEDAYFTASENLLQKYKDNKVRKNFRFIDQFTIEEVTDDANTYTFKQGNNLRKATIKKKLSNRKYGETWGPLSELALHFDESDYTLGNEIAEKTGFSYSKTAAGVVNHIIEKKV